MDGQGWLTGYFEQYRRTIFQPEVWAQLVELKELIRATQRAGRKLICAGNGGSAAIASHVAVDLTKTAGVRCINFNEADLITCLANDYGYERWLEKAIEFYSDPGDLVILISSSGRSPNMVNAARAAANQGLTVVTFTGFLKDNPLRVLGRPNYWVESQQYNIVEMTHHIWLLAVCDLLISEAQPMEHAASTYASSS